MRNTNRYLICIKKIFAVCIVLFFIIVIMVLIGKHNNEMSIDAIEEILVANKQLSDEQVKEINMSQVALDFRKSIVGIGHKGNRIRIMINNDSEEGLTEYLDYFGIPTYKIIVVKNVSIEP